MQMTLKLVVPDRSKGSLGEWSKFLDKLNANKNGTDPLLKKARVPERLCAHLEDRLALAS